MTSSGCLDAAERSPTRWERLKAWARRLKENVFALYLAARDRRTPAVATVVAAVVAAYALSPIDLIPDFIPILGYLDDLVIVPAGVWLAIRLIPLDLFAEFRTLARERLEARPRSWVAAAAIVLIWLWAGALIGWWLVVVWSPG
ncbi:MAG: DUF1232 domain-containing protein [Alphaproteobacteria bacterium]|nr:DUF1232 domain-containing protein [Alphaproteobacteria bacterium]